MHPTVTASREEARIRVAHMPIERGVTIIAHGSCVARCPVLMYKRSNGVRLSFELNQLQLNTIVVAREDAHTNNVFSPAGLQ